MNSHDILIGLHLHADDIAGLEVACSCGDVLHCECDPDGLLSLDELLEIRDRHAMGSSS